MKLTFHSQKKLFANLQAVFRRNTDDLGKQLLRMKLLAIFLTAACVQVSAKTDAQITINVKDVTLDKVFAEIERQTGMMVMYSFKDLAGTKKVTLNVSNASYLDVLNKVFENQPLEYEVKSNSIFVYRQKKSDPAPKAVAFAAIDKDPIEVTVKVVNEEGDPVAGVTIEVKGGKVAGATDAEGVARIKADPNAVLILTAVNIQSVEKAVDGKKDLSIRVIGKTGILDNVQVIAYGKTSQRFSIGNVGTISAEVIEKQPINNPLLALQGRVAGLFITQNNGLAGGGITTLIQGQNSITSGNEPFYVVDGVPYVQQMLPNYGSILGFSGVNNNVNSFGNPLSYLNPNDIESISILKGADATAIYGSRAGNGAILITTKKGRAGQAKVDLNVRYGIGNVVSKLDLLNREQYLAMRREALVNDNRTPTKARDYDLMVWDTTRSADWQEELLGKTSRYTNVNANLSGGTSQNQYFIGLTHAIETSVFPGSFDNKRSAIHISLNNISPNGRFKSQLSADYMVSNNNLPSVDLTASAIRLAPNAPALFNSDGTLNWALNDVGITTWNDAINPIAYIYNSYDNETTNLIGNLTVGYEILKNFELKSSFGYNTLRTNELAKNPLTAVAPQNLPFAQRSGIYVNNNITSWIMEPQITYHITRNAWRFNLLAGFTYQKIDRNGYQIAGVGYNSDEAIEDINSAASITHAGSTVTSYKYNAGFGRIGLNFKDRYLLNLTARRDGSSRFGKANQFSNFGSAGIGWLFSEESFFKDHIKFLRTGKIRASYGTTGNDQIGDYQFLSTYSTVNVTVPYQNITSLRPDGLSNPYLQWERTTKLEVGIDLSFLNDRIVFNGTYYNNNCSNQLLASPLPIATGASGITINMPAKVRNTGLELTLSTLVIKSKALEWTSNINFTLPRNKLVSFPGIENSNYANTLIVGQPISVVRTFRFKGVDPNSGAYMFYDANGNETASPSYPTDYNVFVNIAPSFYGGFENSIRYRQFDLSFLVQFVKQKGLDYQFGSYPGIRRVNQPVSVLDRWQKAGDVKPIQRFNSSSSLNSQASFAASSDAGYTDASYARIKNISLYWISPSGWNKKLHIQSFKLFLQAQNMLTVTGYKGLDPETRSLSALPPLRIMTLGFSLTL